MVIWGEKFDLSLQLLARDISLASLFFHSPYVVVLSTREGHENVSCRALFIVAIIAREASKPHA